MFPKRIFVLAVLLVFLASSTVWWRTPGPALLLAQDDAEDGGQLQIFLPFMAANPRAAATPEGDGAPTPNGLDDGHNHTHTAGIPLLDSWPPQPVGLTDVRWVAGAPSDAVVAAQVQDDQAESAALASPAVQAALGADYIHAATIHSHAKGSTTAAGKAATEIRVAFFSYSNNTTVEALVVNEQVARVQTLAAATYQPEPTRQERSRAITIARDYFVAQGETRVNALHGFVIQAYRAEGATGFYDTRVVYVTFHQSLDERPEYLAWVDLSNAVVLKAVVDRYTETFPAAAATAAATARDGEGQ